jgi:hypothetical protein
VILLKGVIARVATMKRMVQIPVSLVMSEIGFALRFPFSPFHPRRMRGARHARKTIDLIRDFWILMLCAKFVV